MADCPPAGAPIRRHAPLSTRHWLIAAIAADSQTPAIGIAA
jgi:hypothetical protein